MSNNIFGCAKFADAILFIFSLLVKGDDNAPDIEDFLDSELPDPADNPSPNKKLKSDVVLPSEDIKPFQPKCAQIERENPATCTCRCEDPVSKLGRIVVVHELDSGIEECEVLVPSMEGGSTQAIIKHPWAVAMTVGAESFKREIESGQLSPCHPSVLAVDSHVKTLKQNVSDVSHTRVIVPLPCPAQSVGCTKRCTTKKNPATSITTVIVCIDLLEVDTSFVSVGQSFSVRTIA